MGKPEHGEIGLRKRVAAFRLPYQVELVWRRRRVGRGWLAGSGLIDWERRHHFLNQGFFDAIDGAEPLQVLREEGVEALL